MPDGAISRRNKKQEGQMKAIRSFTFRELVWKPLGVVAAACLVLALVAGCSTCKVCGSKCAEKMSAKSSQQAEINTEGLKVLIATGAKMTLLDARTGKYDDGMRIPNALSLDPAAPAEEAAKVIPSKDALVVTYCSNTKCMASWKLASHLKELGYLQVIEYPQGIEGWMKAGNEVKKVK